MKWEAGGAWDWHKTKVYDCRTGLVLSMVRWIDDETHMVGFWRGQTDLVDIRHCPRCIVKPGEYALINAPDPADVDVGEILREEIPA